MNKKLKEPILTLRANGLSYNKICEKLNCAKSTVSYYCSETSSNKINDDFLDLSIVEIDNIKKLRKEKKSYDEIVEKTNIKLYKIKIICKKLKLTTHHKYGEVDNTIIKQIQPLYDKIGNIKKVAYQLGISYDTARKYVILKERQIVGSEDWKKKNSNNVIEWRKRKKIELVEYKGGECEICGYKKSFRALEFHHKDPSKKDFTISGKSWSFERLKIEVDKCILVCSNCHAEIHDEIDK